MSHPPNHPPSRSEEFEEDYYSQEPSRDVSGEKLKRLLHNLVGRWHWIALGLILGFLGATYYVSKAPKKYTATATLLIKQQTGSVMVRDQVDEIDLRSQEAMNTVAERIRRMDLLERVASRQDIRELPGLVPRAVDWQPLWLRDRLGNGTPEDGPSSAAPPPPAALGGMISQWMNISIRQGTRLLDISMTHPVPEVSKALADGVAREYLAEIAGARTDVRRDSIEVLEKRSEIARTSLQTAGGALASYARAIEVHERLDAKEAETTTLQRRYLPKHPTMAAASAELAQLQKQFLQEFDVARLSAIDKAYWDIAVKSLPDRETEPDAFLRMARQQLLARIGTLQSEIASSTSVFNSMLTQIEQSGVNQEGAESSAEVSSLARVPGRPSAPDATQIRATGSVVGLGTGLALALLLIRLDNKYHTVAQISGETGTNVLAAIAAIHPRHLETAEGDYRKQFPDQPEDPNTGWDERLVFRPGTSTTSYAEMYRVLRASVSLLGDETRRKITLFSSAIPGEGKTSTSANFALAAAGQGRRTLLIDLDLRKPSIHHTFGLPRDHGQGGITECLANQVAFEDVVIRNTGRENLHLILSGKRAPNPGELLDIERLKVILTRAYNEYDMIVLDTAPILAVPDTRIIAKLAHNVCLVVRAEYTPKAAVRRVLEIMEQDGTPPSGIVFNAFKEKRRLVGENYSYGYYQTSKHGRSYGTYGSYGENGDDDPSRKSRRNKRRKKADVSS